MIGLLDQFLAEMRDIDVGVPLIGSLVAGALIGFEREQQGKAAGLRTHIIVCFSACLMTLLGLRMEDWHAQLPAGTQIVSDMSRMPHAILTGIGFLGAGVIFRDGFNVQGLTTAATLWLTAALGIVFGTGLVGLASLGTLIALVVLVVLRLIVGGLPQESQATLDLSFPAERALPDAEVAQHIEEAGVSARLLGMSSKGDSGRKEMSYRIAAPNPAAFGKLTERLQKLGADYELSLLE